MRGKSLSLSIYFYCFMILVLPLMASNRMIGGPGNGNMAVEVKNVAKASQEMELINQKYSPEVKNYNEYTNNLNSKKAANLTILIPKENALTIMEAYAGLGTVQSKSYNEYTNYIDSEKIQEKIVIYKKYLEKSISSPAPEPEIVVLLTQQIESLESQLRNSNQPDNAKAQIYITLKEKGYDTPSSAKMSGRDKYLILIASSMLLLMLFLLGFVTGLRIRQKKDAPLPVK